MKPYQIDVPVLIIFFTRHDTLKEVFASVREARPSTLLLWQDGPRKNNPNDKAGIQKCREIVEDIDWECKVYKNYHEENIGCDPSTFLAQKWAFSLVEKCIILEDDMVPSQSYYKFCKELLDKYENDERINHICGINFVENECNCTDDYLFSYYGTGAWASWKRVAEGWDDTYSFLDDSRLMNNIRHRYPQLYEVSLKKAYKNRNSGKAHWETILGYGCHSNNRLVIIPRRNLVTNIGVAGGTHSSSLHLMNKRIRGLFFMKSHELEFPLKHPKYIIADYQYLDEMSKIHALGRPFLKLYYKIDYYIKYICYGEAFKAIASKFKKK